MDLTSIFGGNSGGLPQLNMAAIPGMPQLNMAAIPGMPQLALAQTPSSTQQDSLYSQGMFSLM